MLNDLPAHWLAPRLFLSGAAQAQTPAPELPAPQAAQASLTVCQSALRATSLIPTRKLSTGRKPTTTQAGLVAGASTPKRPVSLERQMVQPQDNFLNRHPKFNYFYTLKYDDRFRFDCKK